EVGRRLARLDPREQFVEHGSLTLGGDHRAGEHVAQLRILGHHPLEVYQLFRNLIGFVTLDDDVGQSARITICDCGSGHKLVVGAWWLMVSGWKYFPPTTLFHFAHLFAHTR